MLRDADVPIKRTDNDGTVSIVSDGRSWRLDDKGCNRRSAGYAAIVNGV